MESVKAASEVGDILHLHPHLHLHLYLYLHLHQVYSPLTGKVLEANGEVEEKPGLVGWAAAVKHPGISLAWFYEP